MESKSSRYSSSNSTVKVTNQSGTGNLLRGMKLENPFSFKVLQVFTGFGIGCGVGIGRGSPINLGALPMVNQVIGATRGATDAFSGVTIHANNALRKMGAKNIQAGIGCGVGFGHGFGFGIALKPGVVQKVQASILQMVAKLMTRIGTAPNISSDQGLTLQNDMSMVKESSIQNPLGNFSQLVPQFPGQTSQGSPVDTSFGRTEKVLGSFLRNPIVKGDGTDLDEVAEKLRSENNLLQMVLKHQQVIDKLKEENEKLRCILVEDLKISPSELQTNSIKNKSPCTDCFECRRKQRQSR